MTRAAWPSSFGRGRSAPLQVDVPQRLPGGTWGAPPASGTLVYDAQGLPIVKNGSTVTGSASAGLCQAEWPMPCRWECQLGVSIEPINGNVPWNNLASSDVFRIFWQIVASVESAAFPYIYVAGRVGPGLYPYAYNEQNPGFNPTGGSTLVFMAQTLRASIVRFEVNADVNLANTQWAWSSTCLLGLTSSGVPA